MCNGIGLIVVLGIYLHKVVKVRCTFHSLRNTVPRQATACGLPHYQVEPVYQPDTEDQRAAPETSDSIDNYIRESESNVQRN